MTQAQVLSFTFGVAGLRETKRLKNGSDLTEGASGSDKMSAVSGDVDPESKQNPSHEEGVLQKMVWVSHFLINQGFTFPASHLAPVNALVACRGFKFPKRRRSDLLVVCFVCAPFLLPPCKGYPNMGFCLVTGASFVEEDRRWVDRNYAEVQENWCSP